MSSDFSGIPAASASGADCASVTSLTVHRLRKAGDQHLAESIEFMRRNARRLAEISAMPDGPAKFDAHARFAVEMATGKRMPEPAADPRRPDYLRAVPDAAPAGADEFVHWARQGAPLGDPAQCGSATGRATRVASAVTCPKCVAWMSDEAWTSRSDTFGGAA